MINQTRWVYYGAAIAVAGLLLGVVARRYQKLSLVNAADKALAHFESGDADRNSPNNVSG